jgi:hypothetical protein
LILPPLFTATFPGRSSIGHRDGVDTSGHDWG